MTAIDTARALIFTGGTIPSSGASAGDLAAEISARVAADQAFAIDLATRRVSASWVRDFSGITFPNGTSTVIQAQGDHFSIWVPTPAPGTVDPDLHQQDATGGWWTRSWDSRVADQRDADLQVDIATRRSATIWSRDFSAVTFPNGTDTIIQRQNDHWSLWLTTNAPETADPDLHRQDATGGWWTRVFDSRVAHDEATSGRVYYGAAMVSPSGADIPEYAQAVITGFNAGNTARTWRPVGAPSDGQETENIVQDANGRWWIRLREAEIPVALRDAGLLGTTNVGGTGDAITADLLPTMTDAGITTIGGASEFEYIPVETNSEANPTITIGGQTFAIRNADGGAWPAGAFVVGRAYKMRRRGGVARVVSGDTTRVDLDAMKENSGLLFYSRQAAVDFGQERLPGTVNRIVTMEDGRLVFRGPGASDDALFSGFPGWGVVQVVDVPGLREDIDGKAEQADLDAIGAASPLVDQTVPIITIGDPNNPLDILRLLSGPYGGLLGNFVTDLHEPDQDDGYVIERVNGRALRKLYPDGQDLIPSARFWDRMPESARGGGETADGWASQGARFTAQAGQHGVLAVDRFIDRADGVRLPVPVVNGQTRRAIIVSSYGQSNANVTRMGDDLFWDTPPFPYHAFMLDDMNPFGSGNHRGGMMGWQGVAVQRGTRMINASEALRDTQDYASAALSRLLMWDGGLRRVGLVRSSAWGGQRLIGASTGQGIWKDSAGDYTQAWANWTGDIDQSYDLLTDAGYEVDAIYICFTHQEADWQTDPAAYLSNFLAMKADREALLAAAYPGVRVHWFVDQASGSGLRSGSYLGGLWPVREAIADAAEAADNITMVMPRYWMPFGLTQGGAQEDIHHSYRARIWQGEVFAHAMREIEGGREWRCPRMASATVSGNDVIVDFDSLMPLVIDPTFCKVRRDMGFTIDGGSVLVTDVRLTGQRQITVTCATAPTTSVAYAYREQDGDDVSDEWPISTGAVRDAWIAPSQFDSGKQLVRAALGGIINL